MTRRGKERAGEGIKKRMRRRRRSGWRIDYEATGRGQSRIWRRRMMIGRKGGGLK